MPLRGYVCPQGGEEPGRANPIDYCLGSCKNPCVAPPLLGAMFKADTENYHQGDYISASMLAGEGCARQVVYERYEDFYDLPRKRFWPFRGTVIHRICEGAGDFIEQFGWLQEMRTQVALTYPMAAPVFEILTRERPADELAALTHREYLRASFEADKWLAEQRLPTHGTLRDNLVVALQRPIDPVEVTERFTGDYDSSKDLVINVRGTADGYNPFIRTLADMKSQADAKADMVIRGTKQGEFSKNLEDSHVWQFNIYRWLIAQTKVPPELNDRFEALGLPRLKAKTFPAPTRLWMQGISMMEIPRSGVTYAYTKRGQTTLYDIDDVPVLTMQQIEDFVRPRALFWYKHLKLGLPAPVVGEKKAWLCRSCAFNGEVIDGERCHPTAERAAQAEVADAA